MLSVLDSMTLFKTVRHALIKALAYHKEQSFQLNRILKEDETINLMGPMLTQATRASAEENEEEAERLQFILSNRCLDMIEQEFGSSFVFEKKKIPVEVGKIEIEL